MRRTVSGNSIRSALSNTRFGANSGKPVPILVSDKERTELKNGKMFNPEAIPEKPRMD